MIRKSLFENNNRGKIVDYLLYNINEAGFKELRFLADNIIDFVVSNVEKNDGKVSLYTFPDEIVKYMLKSHNIEFETGILGGITFDDEYPKYYITIDNNDLKKLGS